MTPPEESEAPRVSQARGGELDPVTLEELQTLARSTPRSGREAAAQASAIRTLERLDRGRRRQKVPPPMPEGWYPYPPGDPSGELDRLFLQANPQILQRQRPAGWLIATLHAPSKEVRGEPLPATQKAGQ
jgi:hypothetical protein